MTVRITIHVILLRTARAALRLLDGSLAICDVAVVAMDHLPDAITVGQGGRRLSSAHTLRIHCITLARTP